MRSTLTFPLTAILLAITSLHAAAQAPAVPESLRSAAQKAIAANPEVTARFNAFQAADNEIDVARGGYFPRLDLGATVGKTRDRITGRLPSDTATMSNNGASLTLSQILWDGQSTRKEVERLGHASMTRYFELLDTTEQTALEAARAHYDVQRYRKLVALAEDNYVQHKHAFDQIQSRVKAGVGRGVDLEQASARVALAESNLLTETSNLHDVTARYLRVVGEAPPAALPAVAPLNGSLPSNGTAASDLAASRSPAVSAAVENLRAVRAQAEGRDSAFQPKVEARVRGGAGRNFDGVQNQKNDVTGEIGLTWNLFNGGSDRARTRQYADLVNQAADQRDKACRDARQTAAIAYNDTLKLKDQIRVLERNTLAIQKARDAYRQQFDIGQRSLLDLLNAENELYTAKRSLSNAEHDLSIAQARAHASAQTLTQVLGVTRTEPKDAPDTANWTPESDAAGRCPANAGAVATTSLDELDRRAGSTGAPAAAPAPAAPAPVAAPAAAAAPATVAEQRLRDWAAAWMAKDADRYLGFYGKDFTAAKMPRAKWEDSRRRLVTKPGNISVDLSNIHAKTLGPDMAQTTFTQKYESSNFKDTMEKTLVWKRIGNDWVIVRESNR